MEERSASTVGSWKLYLLTIRQIVVFTKSWLLKFAPMFNFYFYFVFVFVCLFGTKMVVRAVAAVLTAEEQAMNPTPHPRQRRTRPGD